VSDVCHRVLSKSFLYRQHFFGSLYLIFSPSSSISSSSSSNFYLRRAEARCRESRESIDHGEAGGQAKSEKRKWALYVCIFPFSRLFRRCLHSRPRPHSRARHAHAGREKIKPEHRPARKQTTNKSTRPTISFPFFHFSSCSLPSVSMEGTMGGGGKKEFTRVR